MMRIGGHFHSDHPLQDAVACGAKVAQFFLGDPQGWKGPVIPGGDPGALRDAYAAADVDVYIHAPYVINVASTNNRIRIPSRKLLDQQLKAAGGNGAMARSLEAIARLWEGVSAAADGASGAGNCEVGFCLDTCHANSAGIELADAVDRVKAITGRIDLVHCNNSRDEFGSGADRHANFEAGTIEATVLLDVVRAAGAPVICETPEAGLASDIRWLQAHLDS